MIWFTSLNGHWKLHCREARVEVGVPVRRPLHQCRSEVFTPRWTLSWKKKKSTVSKSCPFAIASLLLLYKTKACVSSILSLTCFIALDPWLWNYRTVQNTDTGKALFNQGTKDFLFLSVLQVSGEMWPLKYWDILNVLYIVVWSGGAGINFSLVALLVILLSNDDAEKSSHSVIYW